MIEVEFDIYNIESVDVDDLECAADGINCEGNINIKFQQGDSDPIPYDKVVEDVKNQLKRIYKEPVIIESQNTYIVTINYKNAKRLDHLTMKMWIRKSTFRRQP